jgi:hypothetical protein
MLQDQTFAECGATNARSRDVENVEHRGQDDGSVDDLIGSVWVHARDFASGRQRQRGQVLDEQVQRISAQTIGAFARRRYQVERSAHRTKSSSGSRAKHDLAKVAPLKGA